VSTSTAQGIRFEITGGGNKFQLFQQLMLIGLHLDDRPTFPLEGHLAGLQGSSDDHIEVWTIGAEDGSGDSWIISGGYPTSVPKAPRGSSLRRAGGVFDGIYNTRTRKGYIVVRHY
jgi:hypothetical protein